MNAASGMRASAIAASAPISEVFAVMPSDTSSCMPMIAPKTQSTAMNSNVAGSNRLGCRRGTPSF